jgi:hypothetical protein
VRGNVGEREAERGYLDIGEGRGQLLPRFLAELKVVLRVLELLLAALELVVLALCHSFPVLPLHLQALDLWRVYECACEGTRARGGSSTSSKMMSLRLILSKGAT